jgi:hypothetical protein
MDVAVAMGWVVAEFHTVEEVGKLGASDDSFDAELNSPPIVQSSTFFDQGFDGKFEDFKEADLGWFGFMVEAIPDVEDSSGWGMIGSCCWLGQQRDRYGI